MARRRRIQFATFGSRRNKPAYEILLNTWAFEVARRRRIRFATFGSRRNKPAYFLKFVFRILALASIFAEGYIIFAHEMRINSTYGAYNISNKPIYDITFFVTCQEKRRKKAAGEIFFSKRVLTKRKRGAIMYWQYGRRTVAFMPEWRNWQTPGT